MLNDTAINEVRQYRGLGAFGFQWLCACAVLPTLRFGTTVHIGAKLAEIVDRPLPDADEHRALFELEWFRKGAIPEQTRLALLRELDPWLAAKLRGVFQALVADAPARPHDRQFAAALKSQSANAPIEGDPALMRFASGAPLSWSSNLLSKLLRWLGLNRPFLARLLPAIALAAAALATATYILPQILRDPSTTKQYKPHIVTQNVETTRPIEPSPSPRASPSPEPTLTPAPRPRGNPTGAVMVPPLPAITDTPLPMPTPSPIQGSIAGAIDLPRPRVGETWEKTNTYQGSVYFSTNNSMLIYRDNQVYDASGKLLIKKSGEYNSHYHHYENHAISHNSEDQIELIDLDQLTTKIINSFDSCDKTNYTISAKYVYCFAKNSVIRLNSIGPSQLVLKNVSQNNNFMIFNDAFMSYDGNIYSLDSTGHATKLYRVGGDRYPTSSIAINGIIYVGIKQPDGKYQIIDLNTGDVSSSFAHRLRKIYHSALGVNRIALLADDNYIHIYSWEGDELQKIELESDRNIWNIQFSPDGSKIILEKELGTSIVYSLKPN